jgi:foldase protein PrsA
MKLKRFVPLFVLPVCAGLAAASPGAGTGATTNSKAPADAGVTMADLLPDSVVARGKGFEIKRSQLDDTLVSVKASAAAQGTQISRPELMQIEKKLLDRLIQIRILNAKATAEEKTRGKEEAEKRFEVVHKRAANEEVFVRQLKAAGLTPESLKQQLTDETTAEAVLRTKVKITDEQVKKYYDENPARSEEPERVKLNYITFGLIEPTTNTPLSEEQKKAKRKLADDLQQRVSKGEDIAKLAGEFSDDQKARESGGEVTLIRGLRGVPPEFETAAFALKTNQISEVIVTQYALYIMKLQERTPARKMDLKEAGPLIRKELEDAAITKMLPEYFIQLKKEAGVEILDERLKALDEAQAKDAAAAAAAVAPAK